MQLAPLSAQNVLLDRHRQRARRHAHPVRKELTPLQPDQCAHHAQQGRTRVVLDRRHAHHVQQGRTVRLARRHAQPVLSERHRQWAHHHAQYQAARKDRTTPQ